MLQRRTVSGVTFYASPLLEAAGVPHAFSTRVGGVSVAPFDSLNLGNPGGCDVQDDSPHIAENYRLLQRSIGAEHRRRRWVHQVHADAVLNADDPAFADAHKADALFTADPHQLVAVRTADCVPILLATPDGRRVAAVHAGWRGVIAGVLPRTVAALADPHLLAAVGPCIGFDAFEVGPEVLAAFGARFGDAAPVRRTTGDKGQVDLREACRLQLLEAGLSAEQIDTTDRCTVRHADEFFSHRRDHGVTGRMAALIGPVA